MSWIRADMPPVAQPDARPHARPHARPDEKPGGAALTVLPCPGEAPGVTLARVALFAIAAVGVDRLAGLAPGQAWAVLAAATVWALAPAAGVVTALVGGGVSWLLGSDVLAPRLGELSFGVTDRGHLAVMVLAGAVAVAVGRRAASSARESRQPRESRQQRRASA